MHGGFAINSIANDISRCTDAKPLYCVSWHRAACDNLPTTLKVIEQSRSQVAFVMLTQSKL